MSDESKSAPAAKEGQSWTSSIGKKGEYVRKASSFREWVKSDGSTPFTPDAGRYVLYVSLACPWAHRTLITRRLKGLQDAIGVVVVHPHLAVGGWRFLKPDEEDPCATLDTYNGCTRLGELYKKANAEYSGNYTVPVLWDTKTETIVNNESSEIIRMLNCEFNEHASEAGKALNLYPEELAERIDGFNEWIYPTINNGVYRCGFAKSQEAYNEAFGKLFDALDRVEEALSHNRYLTGDKMTEADVRLFTTLVRFDAVYYVHFKTNKKRIAEYPNMWAYVRDIYQLPGVTETVSIDHIKRHYYGSHLHINPTGIVPLGPEIDFTTAHGRDTRTYE